MLLEEYHEICSYIRSLIKGTEWEGKVYAVGGCCRDELLDREINDIDLAINVPNGGIGFVEWLYSKNLLKGAPTTFPKFGTAKFRFRCYPSHEIESVQTRAEKYTDANSRNPETAFGSVMEDCLRRDLTINSLYYDITNAALLDFSGKGLEDIKHHIIRTPQDAESTFDDDPVRILRCIRFAAKFGWEIEGATWSGLRKNVDRLSIVTPQRAFAEIDKMLTLPNVEKAFQLLSSANALEMIFPICREFEKNKEVWNFILRWLNGIPMESSLRWTAFLYSMSAFCTVSTVKYIRGTLYKMKAPPELIKEVLRLSNNLLLALRWYEMTSNDREATLRQIQWKSGKEKDIEKLDAIAVAYHKIRNNDFNDTKSSLMVETSNKLQKQGTSFFNYRLPIPLRRIMKMVNCSDPIDKKVKKASNRLMQCAFRRPKITRKECEEKLIKWTDYKEPKSIKRREQTEK